MHSSFVGMTEQEAARRKVAIDAGAAIKLQRLDRFGGDLYTTGGVIREIRDENARMLLKTLPQEIHVREPLAQDIAYTKQFAKVTGDIGFLSQNDIELIALTVGLHREQGGSVRSRPALLQTEEGRSGFEWGPSKAAEGEQGKNADTIAASEVTLAHFADENHEKSVQDVIDEVTEAEAEADTTESPLEEKPTIEEQADENPEPVESVNTSSCEIVESLGEVGNTGETPTKPTTSEEAIAEAEEKDEDEDDEDGSSAGEWVTSDNMHRFGLGVKPAADVRATCATADFSVQNVLLQMGITPLTFDGFAVRTVKLWGLVCRACFHFCRDTEKVFCPKCGNSTVQRVPIIVDQDGQAKMLNSGRRMKLKGSVYSIPKPQGGRGWKPIYAEDEIMIGGRDRELRHAQKTADKDRLMRDPFNEDNATRAWYQRGPTSGRSGNNMPRMRAGLGRANPNANNYKHKNGRRR